MSKELAPATVPKNRVVEFSGDLRKLTVNLLHGIMQGDIKPQDAAVVIKGIKEINVSLYSEIKHMSLLVELGRDAPELGALPLYKQQP